MNPDYLLSFLPPSLNAVALSTMHTSRLIQFWGKSFLSAYDPSCMGLYKRVVCALETIQLHAVVCLSSSVQ